MIIIDKPGQTCNRFWSYLDTIGYAIEKQEKIYIISWDPSIEYYRNLLTSEYTSFPMYSRLFINLLGEQKYLKLSYRIANNRISRAIYKVLNIELIYGWEQRASDKYFPLHLNEILGIFKPNIDICNEVEEIFNQYKKEEYFIIGVHIRRGDYQYWENGKYYFELNEYARQMQSLLEVYSNKKVVFFISTNEKRINNNFDKFNFFKIKNATVAHDLYALSLCDRIMGPLSTFSRWASFYGGVPLCFINKDKLIKSDTEFSVIKSFYKFENGKEIINLTDKFKSKI